MNPPDYQTLCRLVKNDNWPKGISDYFDGLSQGRAVAFAPLLRNRLANCKLLTDLSSQAALVIDSGLGTIVDSYTENCKNVFCLDTNFSKLQLIKVRNREKNKHISCILWDSYCSIPLKNASIGVIFITDISLLFDNGTPTENDIATLMDELWRVLTPNGFLFFTYHRREHKWRQGKFVSAVSQAGFGKIDSILFGGVPTIPTEFVLNREYLNLTNSEVGIFRQIVQIFKKNLCYPVFSSRRAVVACINKERQNTLEKILDYISEAKKESFKVEKILLQSSTIVFLQKVKGNGGLIIRIPYDQASLSRCRQNYAALHYLNQNKEVICTKTPEGEIRSEIDGTYFFVESRLPGYTFDHKCSEYDQIVKECSNISLQLFTNTQFNIQDRQNTYQKILNTLFTILRSPYLDAHKEKINSLERYLEDFLSSKTTQGCVCHGDFKAENVLFDKHMSPIGIIDWDLFMKNGFPLLDLLHLLGRRRMLFYKCNLMSYVTENLFKYQFDQIEEKLIRNYLDRTDIDQEIVPIAIILYWLHHINYRIGFHQIKQHHKWFKTNVIQQLSLLKPLIKSGKRNFKIGTL